MARGDPAPGQSAGVHSSLHLLAEVAVHAGRVQQQADVSPVRDVAGGSAQGTQLVI